MKAILAGKAFVINADMKVADIKRAAGICPEALQLFDDKKLLFAVTFNPSKGTSISNVGINFDTEAGDGTAQLTLCMDKQLDKEQLADAYGMALIRLAEVEEKFAHSFNEAKTKLTDAIAVVQDM